MLLKKKTSSYYLGPTSHILKKTSGFVYFILYLYYISPLEFLGVASNDELAVDIVYCNDFQLVESGPGIRPFSAAIFATNAHRLVHFRRLRHLWIV